MPDYPKQNISFHELDRDQVRLEKVLGLAAQGAVPASVALRQLRQIEIYATADEMKARVAVVEDHYIDRDYMEDHSVFYSRSLLGYPNHCKRVHFFRGTPGEIEKKLNELTALCRKRPMDECRQACRKFSEESYCGFLVVKPLPNTPVGKTVLATFPHVPEYTVPGDEEATAFRRYYDAAREYRTHLLGVELTVRGLAFQQQDVGVAACATTAIWTALQKTRDSEELGPSTPAHITARATQSSLPFGRSMPSEGLSIDQMCQAIGALGVSPILTREPDLAKAQAELYSASRSGLAPVLVIKRDVGTAEEYHAVAVVGVKLRNKLGTPVSQQISFEADRLEAVYIHDDRCGPYLRAAISANGTTAALAIRVKKGENGTPDLTENWVISHIITPTHTKVRLSLSELYRAMLKGPAKFVGSLAATMGQQAEAALPSMDVLLLRSFQYHERVLFSEKHRFPEDIAHKVVRELTLPRYVGVVRLEFGARGALEVLVDTTSTFRNLSYLAVLTDSKDDSILAIAEEVAENIGRPLFRPSP